MFTRPPDLDDSDVADSLTAGWGIEADSLVYAPLGFGSHHWHATAGPDRWFVTVDDLDAKRRDRSETTEDARIRLAAALATARALRDGGLDFVVAPLRAVGGGLIQPIGERWAAALYPHVDGESHEFGPYRTGAERSAVIDRLVELHRAQPPGAGIPLTDDLSIPRRRDLERALAGPSEPWTGGPFGEPARELLARHAEPLSAILGRYDALAASVSDRQARFVVTHGEPHRANTITTADGPVLIDWDTALRAPPERDLWMLIDEDRAVVEHYAARSGVDVDPEAVSLYRLWWDLCEISLFVDQFRSAHDDSRDVREAWAGLERHLDPSRWAGIC